MPTRLVICDLQIIGLQRREKRTTVGMAESRVLAASSVFMRRFLDNAMKVEGAEEMMTYWALHRDDAG